MVRRSAPASSRCVAKQWRNVWGWTCFWMPARWAAFLHAFRDRFRIDGLITVMPAVAWKQPYAGLSRQAVPVLAQFLEQFWAEHHIAIFASLAALDVNHHALAVDVTDFQVRQVRRAGLRWRRASSAECDGRECAPHR